LFNPLIPSPWASHVPAGKNILWIFKHRFIDHGTTQATKKLFPKANSSVGESSKNSTLLAKKLFYVNWSRSLLEAFKAQFVCVFLFARSVRIRLQFLLPSEIIDFTQFMNATGGGDPTR
jgi:hypothetical protein